MSWNKNTIKCSYLDIIAEVLDECGVSYKITILGKVIGMGLDDYFDNGQEEYEIRKLEYKDKVVIEKMIRHPDCDMNDTIISCKFISCKFDQDDKILKNWKIEEMFRETD